MFDDSTADFWKDIIMKIQQQNMNRKNAQRLNLCDAEKYFADFALMHPDLNLNSSVSSSYATWEISLTDELKLRLFIQNQIKATFLQKNGGDFVKLADARFLNNPFPEIDNFIRHLPEYLEKLKSLQMEKLHHSRRMKVARQFIIAFLNKKFEKIEHLQTVWSLEEKGSQFCLKTANSGHEKNIEISAENFAEELKKELPDIFS